MRPRLGKKGEAPKLVIRLSPELKSALSKAAAESRRTVSDFTRLLIEDALKDRKRKGRKGDR